MRGEEEKKEKIKNYFFIFFVHLKIHNGITRGNTQYPNKICKNHAFFFSKNKTVPCNMATMYVSPKEISWTIVPQLGRPIVGCGIIFSSIILCVGGGDNVTMTSNEPKVRMCVFATRGGVFVDLKSR